jgi:hypothetical protein
MIVIVFFESRIRRRESGASAPELTDAAAEATAKAGKPTTTEEGNDDHSNRQEDEQINHADRSAP